jgi:ryanodine receptor 2
MNVPDSDPTGTYHPKPDGDMTQPLPAGLEGLIEGLARNIHDRWAATRMEDGWTWGPTRSDALHQHPSLVPYEDLPETEKAYDRLTARETLAGILGLGYRILPPE